MRSLLIAVLLFAGSVGYAHSVRCWGYTSLARDYVDGYCKDGTFSGYTLETHHWVNGTCHEGGTLSGTDTVTHEWVSGQCDQNYPRPYSEIAAPENLDELE
jgi:hypothetical protein